MSTHPFIGLGGDFVTFLGSVVLACDAILKQRQFRRIKESLSKQKENSKRQEGSPEPAQGSDSPLDQLGGPFIVHNMVLHNKRDVDEAVSIHQSARLAILGCSLLVFGFILILVGKLYELGPQLKNILFAIKG